MVFEPGQPLRVLAAGILQFRQPVVPRFFNGFAAGRFQPLRMLDSSNPSAQPPHFIPQLVDLRPQGGRHLPQRLFVAFRARGRFPPPPALLGFAHLDLAQPESMVVTSRRVAHPKRQVMISMVKIAVFQYPRCSYSVALSGSSARKRRPIKQTANDAGLRAFAVCKGELISTAKTPNIGVRDVCTRTA